jgi:glycosyltransferase involved in cell wall biosynthesis
MSFGCVPVVSSLECFNDFIENNISGFVFNHRSENSAHLLSDILVKITNQDSDVRIISGNCYHKSKQYSLESIAKLYIQDFSELIN